MLREEKEVRNAQSVNPARPPSALAWIQPFVTSSAPESTAEKKRRAERRKQCAKRLSQHTDRADRRKQRCDGCKCDDKRADRQHGGARAAHRCYKGSVFGGKTVMRTGCRPARMSA